MSRAHQLQNEFMRFHRENPRVWDLFQRFTLQVIERGFQHYSSDAICHRIRWETQIETVGGEGFKINDHFTSFYARLFHQHYPQYQGFFRNRTRISLRQPERD